MPYDIFKMNYHLYNDGAKDTACLITSALHSFVYSVKNKMTILTSYLLLDFIIPLTIDLSINKIKSSKILN